MQLSEKERLVLGTIEHQAEAPVNVIQKSIPLRAHSIHYYLSRLRERGVIVGKAPFINPYMLGYTDYTLYCSLSSTSTKATNRLIERLVRTPGVSWVAKLGGEYQLGVAICAKRIEEVSGLLADISREFGNLFYQKSISVRVSFHAFGRKHLWRNAKKMIPLRVGLSDEPITIDELDQKILSGMSNMAYSSRRDLSRLLGIPFSTLERRVRALEEAGVIAGHIYRLNLSEYNFQTHRLLLYSRGVDPEVSTRLYEYSKKHPQILHFIECMGAWDYEIGVEVTHSEEVTNIVQTLHELFGNDLIGVKTMQIFRHVKYSSYPFH